MPPRTAAENKSSSPEASSGAGSPLDASLIREPRAHRASYVIVGAVGTDPSNGSGRHGDPSLARAADTSTPTKADGVRSRNDGPTSEPLPGRRILITAANRSLRDGFCESLLAAGFQTTAIELADIALEVRGLNEVGCVVVGIAGPDDSDAFRAMQILFAADAKLAIIAVGSADSADLIISAMRAGARDYIASTAHPGALIATVQTQLERSATARPPRSTALPPIFNLLSDRECEVLDLVVRGHSTKQIAAQIGRVEKTVEYHRKRIMGKLGVSTAVQLVRLVTLHGWRCEEHSLTSHPE